jgi:hypothetical protein
MTKENVAIPASFWDLITEEEFAQLCLSSTLNTRQTRKLWKHLGRTDKPPASVDIAVNADDVKKLWPAK